MAFEDNTSPNKRWLSDALLIAGAPVLVYVLTLAFEMSFAGTFDVPFQFVAVTWTSSFVMGVILLVTGAIAFVLCSIALSMSRRANRRPGYLRAFDVFPAVVLLATSVAYVSLNWRRMIVGEVVGFALGVASSIFFRRERQHHEALDPKGVRRLVVGVFALMWLLAAVNTALLVGTATARFQKEFYVPRDSPGTVVLGIWGDTVVSAPFDRKTHAVKQEYLVTKISDHSSLDLRVERVGPLHVDDSPEPDVVATSKDH
jgi:hypothetical protein